MNVPSDVVPAVASTSFVGNNCFQLIEATVAWSRIVLKTGRQEALRLFLFFLAVLQLGQTLLLHLLVFIFLNKIGQSKIDL